MTNTTRTVLIIDDDVMLADLLAAIVEDAGCRAIVATDGAEGVALARTHFPDVVLCDMSMPGLTGAEVLRAIREDTATGHIPLVLMSGHEHLDLQGVGADAFLPKPFSPEKVLDLLRTILRQETKLAA